jgi:hypothetical protein
MNIDLDLWLTVLTGAVLLKYCFILLILICCLFVQLSIIQLFNGCGCNRPNYLSWGTGNDQVFYCMRPTAECNRTLGHLKILKFEILNWNLKKKNYFRILTFFENFRNFEIFRNFWNFEIFWNFWSFEICCPMKKRFKGQFNSQSCNSLLKTIDASIDHKGAKNAKIS